MQKRIMEFNGSIPKSKFVLVTLLAFLRFHSAQSDHIVFLQTISSYSHRVPQWPLVLALIERGHNVTYISGYEGGSALSHPNVTDVIVPEVRGFMDYILTKFDINYRIYGVQPPGILTTEALSYGACSVLHSSPVFQSWLNTTSSVDLIFADTDVACSYGLAAHFRAKHAIFITVPLFSKYYEAFGISPELASYPMWEMLTSKPPLSFLRRVASALLPPIWRGQQILFYKFLYMSLFAKTFGGEVAPELYDMEANSSLLIINGNYLEDYPRAYPPFVIKVPGMHIRDMDADALDPILDTFISAGDSTDFIYISFGTVVHASSLPLSFREIFFRSIEAFPKTAFIWRWQGPLPESYPKNLLLLPWINQQKLLAHPKIKGFITQSGRPSMQEAFYHGVPIIAFPILADQDFNAYRYDDIGTAIFMDIGRLTQTELIAVIGRALNDKEWRNHVQAMSRLGRDVPQPPVEVALWWTEFVLRHTQEELNLMKSFSQNLFWFQRRDLDVWAFVLCSTIGICLGLYHLGVLFSRRTVRGLKSKPE